MLALPSGLGPVQDLRVSDLRLMGSGFWDLGFARPPVISFVSEPVA